MRWEVRVRVRGKVLRRGGVSGDVLLVLRKGLLVLWALCRMGVQREHRVFGVLATLCISRAGLCAWDAWAEHGTRAGDAPRLGTLCSMACSPP